ncbi:hypothetical protein B0H11DRAFT_2222088 [Mycena galericulata]|nr:hypothetical protein B0H11DRAFT_2222088 [Mycena galericulata]
MSSARVRRKRALQSNDAHGKKNVPRAPWPAAAATLASSAEHHPGSCTPITQIASALRSGAVSPSSRYRTALSSRLVLLTPPLPPPPPLPILPPKSPPFFDVDAPSFAIPSLLRVFEVLRAVLEDVDDASALAVFTPWLRLSAIVDARERSAVLPLPAKYANYPLNLAASGPSAPKPKRLGVRINWSVSHAPWPCEEFECEDDGGGVDAEKWRSEQGRAVPPYALDGLEYELSMLSYSVGLCEDSLGAPRSASRMRCRSRSLSLSFLRSRKGPALRHEDEVEVELDMACEAEEEAADGGQSSERDLERSRCAGDCRKRGSLDAAVGDVGDIGA